MDASAAAGGRYRCGLAASDPGRTSPDSTDPPNPSTSAEPKLIRSLSVGSLVSSAPSAAFQAGPLQLPDEDVTCSELLYIILRVGRDPFLPAVRTKRSPDAQINRIGHERDVAIGKQHVDAPAGVGAGGRHR